MNKIKYKHAKTGERRTVKVSQSIHAVMGYNRPRFMPKPVISKAAADRAMYRAGFVRASKVGAA